jgi:hypothetical protein
MLELIFAAALMDTVIAPIDFGTVYVHEWGAVTFTEESIIFGANPLTDPDRTMLQAHHLCLRSSPTMRSGGYWKQR